MPYLDNYTEYNVILFLTKNNYILGILHFTHISDTNIKMIYILE